MFTNHQINGYVYETRFIASWLNSGGQLRYGEDINNFCNWLLSLGLDEKDVEHIKFLATNGRLELEISAKNYLEHIAE